MNLAPDDPFCKMHGWMAHVFVHEAAHAVAAVDKGIEFTHLEITSPYDWQVRKGNEVTLGGLHLSGPPSWPETPAAVAALEMAMAGVLAETVFYDHQLAGDSGTGDMRMWMNGAGLIGHPEGPAAIEKLLDTSVASLTARTKAWVYEEQRRIRAVATALSGTNDGPNVRLVPYSNGPWRLEADDVRSAAGSPL
ncbi:hypothetical protein [Nocardioides plantarum]|uniref:Uncharacterized protein n=1 Tax=Nocardioides plantarum TaxID=29299 RepID=A0ABV5KEN8_9ACTN|nr:hypothetical protein [Nocardioides plantarum]